MHSVCLPLRFLSPLSIFAVQVQRKLLFAQRETLVLIDDGSYIDIELIRYLLEHLLTLSLRVFLKSRLLCRRRNLIFHLFVCFLDLSINENDDNDLTMNVHDYENACVS